MRTRPRSVCSACASAYDAGHQHALAGCRPAADTEPCPLGTLAALLRLCNAAWEGDGDEIDKAIPIARAILDKKGG